MCIRDSDTGHHILIQSFYDGDNKKLAYEIYGTSDGRTVTCLLYTSDAADDLLCVDLGGRRLIKKKKTKTRHTF